MNCRLCWKWLRFLRLLVSCINIIYLFIWIICCLWMLCIFVSHLRAGNMTNVAETFINNCDICWSLYMHVICCLVHGTIFNDILSSNWSYPKDLHVPIRLTSSNMHLVTSSWFGKVLMKSQYNEFSGLLFVRPVWGLMKQNRLIWWCGEIIGCFLSILDTPTLLILWWRRDKGETGDTNSTSHVMIVLNTC